MLPFAGFVARDGGASLPGMILAATIGSLVGALGAVRARRRGSGPSACEPFVERHGKWFRMTTDDLDKAERWFDRRAVVAVLVGRCVPLIRSLVSIPAGFRRMPFAVFAVYTRDRQPDLEHGAVGAGYMLRDNWEDVEPVDRLVPVRRARRDRRSRSAWYVWRRFVSPSRTRPSEITDP